MTVAAPPPPRAAANDALALDADRRALLEAASHAPSGHNAQPWRVTLHDAERWTLDIAPDRRLPAVDPDDREATLSLGAFLETLSTAAPALGLTVTDIQVDAAPAIRLRVTEGPRDDRSALETIRTRHTRRRGLKSEPLSSGTVAALLADIPEAVFLPRDTPQADGLAAAAAEGARLQAWRDDAQEELSHWIRWRRSEAREAPTGLTPESMEMPAPVRWLAHALFRRATVLSPGFRKQGATLAARQAREGAGWIVIRTSNASAPALIDAGRRYQRLGLRAARLGVGVHPMSQMLEEPTVRARVSALLDAAPETVQMVLRIGTVRHAGPSPGPRLPVSAFTRRAG